MCETYFMAVIESLGQNITGLKYQIEMYSKENEELRIETEKLKMQLATAEMEQTNG